MAKYIGVRLGPVGSGKVGGDEREGVGDPSASRTRIKLSKVCKIHSKCGRVWGLGWVGI